MKISKSFIDKLTPPPPLENGNGKQAFYRDSSIPGFGLRITSSGAIAFIVEKRINGKVKRITLGRYGNLTVEQARNMALEFLGKVATGRDPLAEKRADQAKSATLIEAFEDYLLTRKDLKTGTVFDYRHSLNSAFEKWQNKPLTEISKDLIQFKHQELGASSHARANNAMRVLRAVFNHAMHKYEDEKGNPILTSNPVDRLSQSRAWFKLKPKQSIIKPHQLKAWYEATQQLNNNTTQDYLRFVLLTGLRKTEAATLRWSDVDFIDRTFTIPDTKNGRQHTLPTSSFLHELLQRRKLKRINDFVFPGKTSKGHLVEPRTAVDRVKKLSGIEFTLHDLRRTFITIAESQEISAYALKRLLNHKDSNDVTAGYIVLDIDRLREPMEKISSLIVASFEGKQSD